MKIGLFEAGLPNFDHDAGSTAIIELCELTKSLGHEITYYYTGDNPWGRESDLVSRSISSVKLVAHNPDSRIKALQEIGIEAAIISRPGPASEWLPACQVLKIPVIYFGHDIHHVRLTRGNAFATKPVGAGEIKVMQLLEHHIWKNVNAVIYPSREECEMVNAYCGKNHALEMPIYDLSKMAEKFRKTYRKPGSIAKLLFVGGAHHHPNQDAVEWFVSDVLPKLATGFHLKVTGPWPENLRKGIAGEWQATAKKNQTLEFTGTVPHEQLYRLYDEADLVIAPLRYGAGVKRKVAECLALGCPMLSTPIGFEGLDLPDALKRYLLAEIDGVSYAGNIENLLRNDLTNLYKALDSLVTELVAKYSPAYRKTVLEKALSLR